MRLIVSVLLLGQILAACSSFAPKKVVKAIEQTEQKFQAHTGFILYDPAREKILVNYQGDRYFTPASNTKIFTFYSALQLIGDSIPALKYLSKGDSLIFWGTGDPSFLNERVLHNPRVYDFLKNRPESLYFSNHNFQTLHFGPGWAWDDYHYSFSPERSSLPMYGNTFKVEYDARRLKASNPFFNQFIWVADSLEQRARMIREVSTNVTGFYPGRIARNEKWEIPFHVERDVMVAMLADTLKRPVHYVHLPVPTTASTLFSIPADSVYRVMMQDSDNFLAEQLLLVCAGIINDTLNPEKAISFIRENYMRDIVDNIAWVDGSGLSRYNLFTPRSIVRIWSNLHASIPQQRLFAMLATGGKSGTIKNWYRAPEPYIFGKTGTLSNNHCLSGYLVTKKGTVLIFAWMNNNYVATTSEIRMSMQEVLYKIYETY